MQKLAIVLLAVFVTAYARRAGSSESYQHSSSYPYLYHRPQREDSDKPSVVQNSNTHYNMPPKEGPIDAKFVSRMPKEFEPVSLPSRPPVYQPAGPYKTPPYFIRFG